MHIIFNKLNNYEFLLEFKDVSSLTFSLPESQCQHFCSHWGLLVCTSLGGLSPEYGGGQTIIQLGYSLTPRWAVFILLTLLSIITSPTKTRTKWFDFGEDLDLGKFLKRLFIIENRMWKQKQPCLWNTRMAVDSWVGIQTQVRQLRVSVRTSRLSCHDVAIHCFVTTANVFYSL